MPEPIAGRYDPDQSTPFRRGGYGEIFICRDRVSQQRVAVKIARRPAELSQQSLTFEEVSTSIRHEAKVLGSLEHRNIVSLIDHGEWDSRPFVVLQFLPGNNLREVGIAKPRPPLFEIVDSLHQAAQAVAAVHSAGWLHLDVKPENFIRQPDGTVVLFDFGTACTPQEALVPGAGAPVTAAYSAPEQYAPALLSGGHLTEAADIFSFGIVAFELLTGSHPFGGDGAGVNYRIMKETVRGELTEMVPGIPETVAQALKFALVKRPTVRPKAAVLADRLGAWASSLHRVRAIEQASQQLSQGHSVEAAVALEDYVRENPDDIEGYKEVASLLIPVIRSLLEVRDLDRAEESLAKIVPDLITPSQQREIVQLRQQLDAYSQARNNVPRLLQKCREMRERGNHEHVKFFLDRALALDAVHPAIQDFQCDVLSEELSAADNFWERGSHREAIAILYQVKADNQDLLAHSEKAQRYVRNQTNMWRSAVVNTCQVLARQGQVRKVSDFLASVQEFVDGDAELSREVARYLPRTGRTPAPDHTDYPARIRNAIAEEDFLGASRVLSEARAARPGEPQWDALEAGIKAAREVARQRQAYLAEQAAHIRKLIRDGDLATARSALLEARRMLPDHPLWIELRSELDAGTRQHQPSLHEVARKAREEAEAKAREEAEVKAREEAEREAREESERKDEEVERKAREEAELEARLEAELKAREEAELKAQQEAERKAHEEAELQARLEAERKAREEAEFKARQEARRKALEEAALKARLEAERKAREEAELKARQEAERKAREEAEIKARQEAERKAREEAALKARLEAERKAREEAELKARLEAERKARLEAERKAREEAELKAKQEAERKAREEAELKARLEAERKAREEAEFKARQEARRKALEEAEIKARREAERKAREEAERKTREEAELKARQEAERKALEEAELIARQEAERKAREEAELKARLEAERKAREEAEIKARLEVERIAREEAEIKARLEAERKAQEEAEFKARQEARRKALEEAEIKARNEAERKAREEAEFKARQEAERKAREEAELKAKTEAERKAREEAELKARLEAERKAREEAEFKARQEARRKALEEAELKAKQEAERKAREAAELKARQEAERKAREAAELKARQEAERKAREAAELKARQEVERKAREEAEIKARQESERKAREAAELKARQEAERKAREAAELKARQEAERKAREAAELKARQEAERKAREAAELKATQEAERKAREEAELKAKQEAERIAREEAELKAKQEAERIAREAAELKAKQEAERIAREAAELKARQEAERIAREEAEFKVKQEAERKARPQPAPSPAPIPISPPKPRQNRYLLAAAGIAAAIAITWYISTPPKPLLFRAVPSLSFDLSTASQGGAERLLADMASVYTWQVVNPPAFLAFREEASGDVKRVLAAAKSGVRIPAGTQNHQLKLRASDPSGKQVEALIAVQVTMPEEPPPPQHTAVTLSPSRANLNYVAAIGSGRDFNQPARVRVNGDSETLKGLHTSASDPWISSSLRSRELTVGYDAATRLPPGLHQGSVKLLDSSGALRAALEVLLTVKESAKVPGLYQWTGTLERSASVVIGPGCNASTGLVETCQPFQGKPTSVTAHTDSGASLPATPEGSGETLRIVVRNNSEDTVRIVRVDVK